MESKDEDVETPAASQTQGAVHSDDSESKLRIKCSNLFTEWRRCISAYHQFHQYYIHGEFASCKIEKERMYNCFKWRGTGKSKFLSALETSLEQEQLSMHTPTPIWKLRDTPPTDWNK